MLASSSASFGCGNADSRRRWESCAGVVDGVAEASEPDGRSDLTDQLGFERNSAVSASVSRTRLAEYFLVEGVLAIDASIAKRRLALERRHTAPGIIHNIYSGYRNISYTFVDWNMFNRTLGCCPCRLDGMLMGK